MEDYRFVEDAAIEKSFVLIFASESWQSKTSKNCPQYWSIAIFEFRDLRKFAFNFFVQYLYRQLGNSEGQFG